VDIFCVFLIMVFKKYPKYGLTAS